jgi:FdhD protein
MEIRLDEMTVATTMRTPGHDYELAVGFCHSEGFLDGATVQGVRYCAATSAVESEFNVVSVKTNGLGPDAVARVGPVNSACGVCGSTQLASLVDRLSPLLVGPRFSAAVVAGMATAVQERQELFARTGGVHAAALVSTSGEVLLVREDIGRHNAVDKLVGRMVLDSALPLGEVAMFVSSRASYEMVQKAWAAGARTLVAVSAPSALAVATAKQAGMTLVGFVRGDTLNVYCGELA